MGLVLRWVLIVLVLGLLYYRQYLGHALHKLCLHDQHLFHGHWGWRRWWVRNVLVVVVRKVLVVVVIGIGLRAAGVAIAIVGPALGVDHLK